MENNIKVEVIKNFAFKEFNKIKDTLKRVGAKNEEGMLYKGDIFECNKEMAEYLMGKNDNGITVIKIIEVMPKCRVTKKKQK